jgi:hypothetical protein
MVNRGIALGLVALLAFTGACAPLAVHPPYEEAEKGWTIEPGRNVRVVTRDGTRIRGTIAEVDENGLLIGGTRVERDDIAEMWMEHGNLVRPAVLTITLLAVIAVLTRIRWAPDDRDRDVKSPD